MAKHKLIKGAWSQHGNIMILRNEGKPIAVNDYKELRCASGRQIEDIEVPRSSDGRSSYDYSISDYDDYSFE